MPWIVGALLFLTVVLGAAAASAAPTGGADVADDFFSRSLARGGAFLAFGAAYVAGLAACATPCVYPMIGVTVSIFGAKEARSRAAAAKLSLMFVLGIAALYVPLGTIVALTNSQWGRALSNPWVNFALAFLFAAMAASMFGAFELNLPASVQNRLAQVGGVGTRGAFLMGLVSGLIASPCTTAPFIGILGAFTKGGVALGATSVFLFSIGLGTPFFLVGTFAARLPKPGVWMQHVKSFFGIVLLVLTLFYAKNAIPALKTVAHRGTTFLWIAIAAIVVGLGIGAVHLAFSGVSTQEKARKAIGIALATWGGFALISWMQLAPSTYVRALSSVVRSELDEGLGKGGGPRDLKPVLWSTNKADAESRAKTEKRPMVIDFTADWCTACKKMEKTTFVDPRFWKAAEPYVALRLDGSDPDDEIYIEAYEKYGLRGLPSIVILDSNGAPAKIFNGREVDADELVPELEKVQ